MRPVLYTYLSYLLPALVLVIVQVFVPGFSLSVQLTILGISLVITGIPHGALDYLVFREHQQGAGNKHSLLRFLSYYLGLMLCYGMLWWINPSLALIMFLLLSAWHFADSDLYSLPLQHFADNIIRVLWGLWLLLCLLFSDSRELTPYLQQLAGAGTPLIAFAQWYGPYSAMMFWAGLLGWPLVLWIRLRHVRLPVSNWYPLITIMILLLMCRSLPLVLAFAVYFSGWHSLRSFQSVWIYLRQQQKGKMLFQKMLMSSLPFIIGAFAGLAIFFLWSNSTNESLAPLWIFLSLITLPHGLLMHDVFEKAASPRSPA